MHPILMYQFVDGKKFLINDYECGFWTHEKKCRFVHRRRSVS